MRFSPNLLVFVAGLAFQSASWACLNDIDSDTLAKQAKSLPDVVRVITGRFERNPPRFYEMRIERVKRELKRNPSRLSLYDDIAVAHDRVGRADEAITWMNKKKTRLDVILKTDTPGSARRKDAREHLYRYHANLGTFIAHRWLRGGAKRERLSEMKTARGLIAKAIELKPDAHFGREKYQLLAMDWILAPHGSLMEKSGQHYSYSFGSYLWGGFQTPGGTSREGADMTGLSPDDKRKVEGLSGLIVLGNAWESVDIFGALARALSLTSTQPVNGKKFTEMNAVTLECLAHFRSRELIEQGRRPLFATSATKKKLLQQWGHCDSMYDKNVQIVETTFRRLRDEAEEWQKRRTAYMMALMKTGRHPDTDSGFWSGWKDTPPPSLETQAHWQTFADEKLLEGGALPVQQKGSSRVRAISFSLFGLFALLAFLGVRWRLKR